MAARNPPVDASHSASDTDTKCVATSAAETEWDAPRDKPTPKLIKLDAQDATILKFLAGVTFRDTETSIIQRAIRREMATMLRGRGYSVVETDAQTGAFTATPPRARK